MEFMRSSHNLHPPDYVNNEGSSAQPPDYSLPCKRFFDLSELASPSNPFDAAGTFNFEIDQPSIASFPRSPMLSFGDRGSLEGSDTTPDGGYGMVMGEEIMRTHKHQNYLGEEQGMKRRCVGLETKAKAKKAGSIDPQSVAAKNRRQRISQRLRVLQELVPNGTKVDLVTMLERAISYVKFLQLQVKVLEMDELWPSQGGKAPEIGQVKEAIDAISSSSKESAKLLPKKPMHVDT